jgi:predicted esterase
MTEPKAALVAAEPTPRVGPRAPQHLIVVLGSHRAHADDLIPIADALVSRVPHAAAVILTPPGGAGWFIETGGPSDEAAVDAALTRLWPRILKACEAEGVSSNNLSVFGFGQGATLAIAAVAAGLPFACVLALAGRLVGPPKPKQPGAPDLFMSCGERDAVTSPTESRDAAETFSRHGYDVALITAPQLDHAIDPEQIHQAASFLRGTIVGRTLDRREPS